MCVAHSVSISKVTLIQRSPNGRRRIAFVNAPVAPPQTTAGSSSGQVSITGNEKVVATTLPNVTTEQQPLALGKKRLDETTPKDPDHQVTPIKRRRVPSFSLQKARVKYAVHNEFFCDLTGDFIIL